MAGQRDQKIARGHGHRQVAERLRWPIRVKSHRDRLHSTAAETVEDLDPASIRKQDRVAVEARLGREGGTVVDARVERARAELRILSAPEPAEPGGGIVDRPEWLPVLDLPLGGGFARGRRRVDAQVALGREQLGARGFVE